MGGYIGKVGDLEWETTFPDSVKFKCVRCGFCCFGTNIRVSKNELSNFESQYIEPVSHPLLGFGFRIKGTSKGKCPFLENKGKDCNLYAKRPNMCREYPFKVSFVNKNKAYIDLIRECKSVILEDNDMENTVDFNEMVKNHHKNHQDKLVDVNKIMVDEKELSIGWNELLDDLDADELYERLNEKEFSAKEFFEKIKNQLTKEFPYRSYDINDDVFYKIYCEADCMVFDYDYKQMKINVNTLQNKMFSDNNTMKDYLNHFWQRKTSVIDLSLVKHYTKKELSMLLEEVIDKMLQMLLMLANAIAEKNNNKEIKEADSKEAIFVMDSPLLTVTSDIMKNTL